MARDALIRIRPALDVCLWMAGGFLWAALFAHVKLVDRLPPEWEGRDVRVEGVVAQMPQAFERGLRFRFDVESVLTPLAPIPRTLQLSWYQDADAAAPVLHAGERWQMSVRLKRAHGTQNPHAFDREFWQLEHGIRATGYVRTKAPSQRVAALVPHPGYLVERLRERLRDRIRHVTQDSAAGGVLAALAVGDQGAIAVREWRLFTGTGVNHLMSISGLHITMLSALTALLVGWLWRRSAQFTRRIPARKVALVFGFLVACAYAALAGFAVPAQRTVLMLATVVVALLLSRTWSSALVLTLALLVVTLLDPFAVMAAGFWLSFGAVALLMYVAMGRIGRSSALVYWVRTQWAITLGLVPLLLILFQQISVVSPVANAFAIPLISLLVVPLTLAGVVMQLDLLLVFAEQIMTLCIGLLQYLDQAPFAVWQQATPPVWSLLVAGVGVLWLLAPTGFPSRWMGLSALTPMFLAMPSAPNQSEYWVDVLDVGQGLSVLVRTHRHAMLFDAGPAYSAETDAGDRIVVPYLRAVGVKTLNGFVVSHDDSDHSGGAESVLRMLSVGWIVSSLPPRQHQLKALTAKPLQCFAGQRWEWDGVVFEMLYPTYASYALAEIKDNNRSCVLRVSGAGGSVLMPADIEASAEAWLSRENPHLLRADVLLAPHHGSGTSSTQAFVRNVSPRVVVFTNGYRNSFGHPKDEVVQRYQNAGARIYRSDRDGALLFRVEKGGIDMQAWRTVRRRYWYE